MRECRGRRRELRGAGEGRRGEPRDVALAAAEMGERRGYAFPCASVTGRMRAVRDLVEHEPAQEALRQLQEFYGMGVESPSRDGTRGSRRGHARRGSVAWEAACLAAGSGGDTDTIGAIATAICGGLNPCQVPREVVARRSGTSTSSILGRWHTRSPILPGSPVQSLHGHSSRYKKGGPPPEGDGPQLCRGLCAGCRYSLSAALTATAQATVAPTMGLLPMPMKPIISTWAGTEEEPANWASECMRPMVSVMP